MNQRISSPRDSGHQTNASSLVRLMQAGRLGVALFAALAMLRPGFAHAQAGLAYAGGGVLVGHLSPRAVNDGTPSTTYVNTSDSTTVTGLVGEVGWFVRPRVTLGVEIGVPARLTITQDYSYFSPYIRESRYRELTMFGVIGHPVAEATRATLVLVGGGGVVLASALERVATGRFGTNQFDPFSSETARTRLSFGATGGGELDVHVTRRLDVVTQARVLVVPHGQLLDSGNPFATLGLRSMTLRAHLGLRTTF
ncbi:MAG: hypothetical protein U0Q11_16115 [Vicinamibacterales bacterium]